MPMKETTREKKLRDVRNRIARLEAQRESAIAMLVRAETQLPALRKEARRRAETILARPSLLPASVQHPAKAPPVHVPEDRSVPKDVPTPKDEPSAEPRRSDAQQDLPDLPEFLRRGQAAQAAVSKAIQAGHDKDAQARAEITAQQEAEKKAKTARRIEKLKIQQEVKQADLTGARRKMPLTGRAALDALK